MKWKVTRTANAVLKGATIKPSNLQEVAIESCECVCMKQTHLHTRPSQWILQRTFVWFCLHDSAPLCLDSKQARVDFHYVAFYPPLLSVFNPRFGTHCVGQDFGCSHSSSGFRQSPLSPSLYVGQGNVDILIVRVHSALFQFDPCTAAGWLERKAFLGENSLTTPHDLGPSEF